MQGRSEAERRAATTSRANGCDEGRPGVAQNQCFDSILYRFSFGTFELRF